MLTRGAYVHVRTLTQMTLNPIAQATRTVDVFDLEKDLGPSKTFLSTTI